MIAKNVNTKQDIPAIEVHDLTVSYDKKPVLWGVDFKLPSGVICGIIGPNGSGKTTLLKSMMGLLKPVSGSITLFGKPLGQMRRAVSYVPQHETVDWDFPASVLDVVMMGRYAGLRPLRGSSKEDKRIAMESLEQVGMEKFRSRQISKLSGGQKQRVFLARSLSQRAEIYFMDEPFAGVDATTEQTIIEILKDLAAKGKTLLVVHHDLTTVKRHFKWLVLLNMRMVAFGPTHEVFTDKFLSATYGGKLTILSDLSSLIDQEEFPLGMP